MISIEWLLQWGSWLRNDVEVMTVWVECIQQIYDNGMCEMTS